MDRVVFINYRGEDSHSYGALLYTELVRQFGEEHVFLDCESIPAGADFVAELLGRVRSARVMLAVIGHRWLTATDATGGRRIDNPDDWIRRELAEAFTAGVRVIPVLTEQVTIPAELPSDIAALSRCQYRRLRHHDPTADLARIVTDLTSLDPTLAAAARRRDNAPRQLPAAPGLFTGRATELATLNDVAGTTPEAGATVVISAIGGAGGVGKTALALHWAHRNTHRFPDGQLYVNLRGFDPSGHGMPVGEAVRGFLDAFGVDPATLPVELEAQAARYRSLVAGKRMLIVLDNARDAEQVTPLLPGTPTCTVLVTSRRHLAGLVALHGARPLDLDILPGPDARELLARHLGPQRLAAEPQAVADLLEICVGLPLALRIVAARAEQHPSFPLAVLASELRDVSARLDAFDAGHLHANLRAILSWSVQTLSPEATRLFELLGIAPGPDTSLPAAASLAACSTGQVRTVLQELEHASLVQQHEPSRYRMHDLIHLYATETAHRDLAEETRSTALARVVDFYLHTAHTADRLLGPHRTPTRLAPPAPGAHPHPLPDAPAALAWLDSEHACLLAAQHTAAAHCRHQVVWQVARSLGTFHRWRGHRRDDLAVWQVAADATAHLPDPSIRILAHRSLGYTHARLDQHDEAIGHLHQALALAEHHRDHNEQAHTHRALAWAWGLRRNDQQALAHAQRSLDLFRILDYPVWEANALNEVGRHAARLGDYDTARAHCQQALALHRRHHHTDGEATTLDSLGYIDHRTGHHLQAIHHYQQAITLLQPLGNTVEAANTLESLGHPHAALDQRDQARAAWQQALELYQELGHDTDAQRVQRQLDGLALSSRRGVVQLE